jgi:hypothetical protein
MKGNGHEAMGTKRGRAVTAEPAPAATGEMSAQDRELIDAWIAGGRRRTVTQDAMGWWIARDLGVLVKRRKYARGLADQLKGMR